MGLDNYASRSEELLELSEKEIKVFERENINLVEGTFSEGTASFRGKVYEIVVLEITDISLFQYWIPPETVYEMWQAFENCDPYEITHDGLLKRHGDPDSINELRKYFKVCAQLKLGLIGSW